MKLVAVLAVVCACRPTPRADRAVTCIVAGTVVDADGAPVSGALVAIAGADTFTDTGGRFHLESADPNPVLRITSRRFPPLEHRATCAAPAEIRLPRRRGD